MRKIIIVFCDLCDKQISNSRMVHEVVKMPFTIKGAERGKKGLLCGDCFQEIAKIQETKYKSFISTKVSV